MAQVDKKNKLIEKPRILKGFRDFLPPEMGLRNYVLNTMVAVFESFGYLPLQTPTLEYQDILLGKYGQEADRLVYTFEDKGGRSVGLKYDLTVPTSRVLAMYQNDINLPFKRYQIQPVFRAEKPQKGRYREVLQCDVDIFGVKTPLADAEIVAVIYKVLSGLGLADFVIKINSRQVLFALFEGLDLSEQERASFLQSLDKLEKIGKERVIKELSKKGFVAGLANGILEKQEKAQPDEYLGEVLRLVEVFGVPKEFFEFDPSMVRGLDYYTGPIFETYIKKPALGSLTGGGRYDNLVESLGGPSVPATGTTLGLDRICEVVKELGLYNEAGSGPKALVAVFENSLDYALSVLAKLQTSGIKAEIYLDPKESLRGQIAYASKLKIPYVIIAGSQEKTKGVVVVKDMKTGEQEEVGLDDLSGTI
ncbi:MAG: histidine--tRNA ligase [bacterium]